MSRYEPLDSQGHLMHAAEQFSQIADLATGMKRQLTDQGWHEHHAEKLVIAVISQGQQPKENRP